MAVHEPSADFESAVVAMNSAAGHTRVVRSPLRRVPR